MYRRGVKGAAVRHRLTENLARVECRPMLNSKASLPIAVALLMTFFGCSSSEDSKSGMFWDCSDTTSGEFAGQCSCSEMSGERPTGSQEKCERTDYKCCIEERTAANHGYAATHGCWCSKADDTRECDALVASYPDDNGASLVQSCPP